MKTKQMKMILTCIEKMRGTKGKHKTLHMIEI